MSRAFFRTSAVVIAAAAIAAATLVVAEGRQAAPAGAAIARKLTLPAGFRIAVYAEGIENPRHFARGTNGTLFVSTRTAGKVYGIVDANRNNVIEPAEIRTIASGLDMPNGVAFRNGSLYVSAVTKILRYDDIENTLAAPPAPVVVTDKLPDGIGPGSNRGQHNWRYIGFGPDDLLYVSIGGPCNVCEMPDPNYATIVRMKPDGSNMEIYAKGVRDSVGFDWHPVTHELWFTDNGRDNMGDDVPNDELNVAYKAGLHFGFPYCFQGNVADPQLGSKMPCSATEAPVQMMGPHVAAIGMQFYTGSMFPAAYRNAALIAQHGSWNRSQPIGYRVMAAHTDGRRVTTFEPLVDGFLPKDDSPVLGRPAGVFMLPDGSVLVSDDEMNRIYRVTYQR
jgi:glucose/arabinose dehydrogenase